MKPTEEQTNAARRVVEAGLLFQHSLREAQKLGLQINANVFTYRDDGPEVQVTCTLVEEVEVARTPQKGVCKK